MNRKWGDRAQKRTDSAGIKMIYEMVRPVFAKKTSALHNVNAIAAAPQSPPKSMLPNFAAA